MITLLAAVSLMTLSGNVPNTEVWVAHSPKESAIESPKWSPLAASDLVNCRSTEGKVGSIDELATKFKEYENAFNSEAAREILVQLVGAETCRHRPSSATSQIADLMMRALSNAIAEKDALRVAHLTKQLNEWTAMLHKSRKHSLMCMRATHVSYLQNELEKLKES